MALILPIPFLSTGIKTTIMRNNSFFKSLTWGLFALLSCQSSPIQAQKTQEASFPGLALQKGMTTVACRKSVQIYTQPNLKSQTFGYIKLGQEVVIQERTDVVEAFDGLNYYWYKVAIGPDSGYAFGAHLASAYFTTTGGTIHCVHLIGRAPQNPNYVTLEIKSIAAVGREPSSVMTTSFILQPTDKLATKVYNNRGFKDYKNVVIFEISSPKCPEHTQETAFLCKESSLIELPTVSPKSPGCSSISYIFPGDPGGIPNIFQVKTQTGNAAPKWSKFYEQSYYNFLPVKE